MTLRKRIFSFCLFIFLLGQAAYNFAQEPSATPSPSPEETVLSLYNGLGENCFASQYFPSFSTKLPTNLLARAIDAALAREYFEEGKSTEERQSVLHHLSNIHVWPTEGRQGVALFW